MKRLAGLIALAVPMLVGAPLGYANIIVFETSLSGPAESPANSSPGTGFATVTLNDVANTLRVQVTFSGLVGTTTASHIHCCTASPATGTAIVATETPTFGGFPLGVTSGSYDHLFDMTLPASFNSAFITAHGGTIPSAEAALFAGMSAGESYLNIHTSAFPSGEIRGFLQTVPEPATLALLSVALAGLGFSRRRKPR